jgi:hypothetical protein
MPLSLYQKIKSLVVAKEMVKSMAIEAQAQRKSMNAPHMFSFL